MEEKHHEYKGRCVLGGHDIRDENGVLAVFAEQGASVSSMIAAKLLDQLGRVPPNTRRTAGDNYGLVAEKLAVGPVS